MMSDTILTEGKILIIDDEKANVRFLEIILQQAGYINVYSTTDSRQSHAIFCSFHPDIVLLDLAMPHMDGFAVMRQLRQEMRISSVPILVLTADAIPTTKHKALKEGASDFVTKPLDETEVLLRIHNLLKTRFNSILLEARVAARTLELEQAQWETLQREEALRQSNNEILTIWESMTDAFFSLDSQWRFTHINSQAALLWQRDKAELIGKVVWETFPAAINSVFYTEYHRASKEQTAVHFEAFYPPLNVWRDVHAYPSPFGLSVYFRDITERKEAERALAASEERLSLIVNHIDDAVFLLNVESSEIYRFLFVNPSFLKLTGLQEEEIMKKRMEEVLPESGHALALSKYAQAIRERNTVGWQETSHYPAGECVADVRVAPLFDEQGCCTHLIGTVHDITEQKHLQEQMTRSERLAAMGELVAGVAHEINNPLAAISGHAQLLQIHSDPQVQEDGQTIRKMTDRATRIVHSLLTFARQDARSDQKPTPLRPVIEDTLEIMRYKLRKGGVEVVMRLAEPDLSPMVNPGPIGQVLLNLISNAEHALRQREQGRTITIATNRAVYKNQEWAVVCISDNGCGMPENIKNRIFDPFFTTKSQGEGTGLGLSICHGIITEHQGQLEVTSKMGVGTTFTLRLPLAVAPMVVAPSVE